MVIIAHDRTNLSDLEYFGWFVQNITYGVFFPLNFCQKIQKSNQNLKILRNKDFWNSLSSYMLCSKVIFKTFFSQYFWIMIWNLYFLIKTEWEKCPISDILDNPTKTFQIRRFCASLCNNKPWPFLVSKAAKN